MGTNPISQAELNSMRASEEDSLDLVRGIYHNITEYRLHNLEAYTEAAHRGFSKLKDNIDDLLPFRLGTFQSPPDVKRRKRVANWRTPNNRQASRKKGNANQNNRFNGTRGANRARNIANAAARNLRGSTLRRLGAANNAPPAGTQPYKANNNNNNNLG